MDNLSRKKLIYGVSILALVALFLAYAFYLFWAKPKVASGSVVNVSQTFKAQQIVAGKPVQWVAIVNKNALESSQDIIELPKDATSIKAKSITDKEAKQVIALAQETDVSGSKLDIETRKQLASATPRKTNSFTAALLPSFESIVSSVINSVIDFLNPNISVVKDKKFYSLKNKKGSEEFVQVTYQTPAPQITEETKPNKKEVTVKTGKEYGYTNVIAYTNIPEVYLVGEENKIKVKWNNENKQVDYRPYDLDGNGKLDYVEWTVPHLSEQTFQIIYISNAVRLDAGRTPVEDVYDKVFRQDNVWTTVGQNEYLRVTFEKPLTDKNDITIYARPNMEGQSPYVQVYVAGTNQLIATFDNITKEGSYQILLTKLKAENDVFDLKVVGGDIDFDYAVDPITVSFGSENVYVSSSAYPAAAEQLDSTHVVLAYRDGGNSNYGTAKIGTIASDKSISYGDAQIFKSGTVGDVDVAVLDSTHVAIAYVDNDNSNQGTVKIGTVSGTSISFGDAAVSGLTGTISVVALDSTKFVLVQGGNAVVGTVSGNAITLAGTTYQYNSGTSTIVSAVMLDTTHFVVAYKDYSNSSYGTAAAGSVSGTVITFGSETVFNSAASEFVAASRLDSTHFVTAYRDNGNSYYGTAIIGTVSSGTTINFGTEYPYLETGTGVNDSFVIPFDSTHFVVAYSEVNNSDYGTVKVGTISSSGVISYTAATLFNSGGTGSILGSYLDSGKFVLTYNDSSNSNYGTAIVGNASTISVCFECSVGTAAEFSSAAVDHISTANLDYNHFVVAYRDAADSYKGKVRIGTVSGTTITYGTVYTFYNNLMWYTHVMKLDSTHIVVVYANGGGYGSAKVGTISGGTITFGDEYTFYDAADVTGITSAAALDSTHFVVAYNDDAYDSNAVVGTVSLGDDIAFGTANVFQAGGVNSSSWGNLAALDATHFVVVYADGENSGYGTARVGTVSSGSITYGDEAIYKSADSGIPNVAALDATHFVVAYFTNSAYQEAVKIGTVSSGSITYGSEYAITPTSTLIAKNSISVLDSTHFVFGYEDLYNMVYNGGLSWTYDIKLYAVSCSIVGSDIYLGPRQTILTKASVTNSSFEIGTSALTATSYVYAYGDDSSANSTNYGKANILTSVTGSCDSSDATLSNLTISNGTLTPTFASGTTSYTASVSNATTSVTVTPTANESHATIKVNGTTVVSGEASGSISLSVGTNTITTVVTSQNGIGTKTYTITVTRVPDWAACFGGESVFRSSTGDVSSVAKIDSTHFVVAYSDTNNSYYGSVKIGTVSGSTVSYGDAQVFNSGQTSNANVAVIDSTHIVVVYTDTDNSNASTAVVGTISGSSVSFGTEVTFTGISSILAVTPLDSTHVAVAYSNAANSYYGTARIGTVSGTNISFGTASVFNSASTTGSVSLATLDSTHFVVGANSSSIYVGSVSGTDITFGTGQSVAVNGISLTALDSTHFVAAYSDNNNSHYGTVKIGTVSGTTITLSSAYIFNSADTQLSISTSALDSSHFVITYEDWGNSERGTARIGTYSDSEVFFGSEYVFNSAVTDYFSVASLSSTKFVTSYTDHGNSNYGTTLIGTASTSSCQSSDATLSNLTISSGTLTPTFASATTSYTDSVTNATTSVTVTPTVNESNATIKVNGTTVASGSASQSISLNVGSNTITTVVTAQDGSTTKTYTITVTRASDDTWLTGWTYRKKITISNDNVGSNLTDFPLHVKINSDSDIATSLSTGYDIRFTSSDKQTLLKYEREYWVGGNGSAVTAEFWVKVPTVATASDTDIYIYWGKSDATDGQDATNVWDSNFKGVYHLITDGTNLSVQDSTSNNNDLTNSSATTTSGKMDGAANFAGSQYMTTPTFTSLNTISGWARFSSTSSTQKIFRGAEGHGCLGIYNGSWENCGLPGTAVSADTWYYVSIREAVGVYVDGNLVIGATSGAISNEALNIGGPPYSEWYYGKLDEVRLSSTSRSVDWIKFEYCNMMETATSPCIGSYELTFGPQDPTDGGGGSGNAVLKVKGGMKVKAWLKIK